MNFQCDCGKRYKHQSNLIRHKKGNVRQGIAPCSFHIKSVIEQVADTEEATKLMNRLEEVTKGVELESIISEPLRKLRDKDEVGFIYLIREREFIRLGESIYKVGSTVQELGQHRINRLDDYKKGSELLFLWQCVDPSKVREIESRIVDELKRNFEGHPDGREYFRGSRFAMVRVITEITNECDRLFESAYSEI